MEVLGGGVVSYARGTPVFPQVSYAVFPHMLHTERQYLIRLKTDPPPEAFFPLAYPPFGGVPFDPTPSPPPSAPSTKEAWVAWVERISWGEGGGEEGAGGEGGGRRLLGGGWRGEAMVPPNPQPCTLHPEP